MLCCKGEVDSGIGNESDNAELGGGVGPAVTMRVTSNACGLFVASAAVTETCPEYVPGATLFSGIIPTESVAGVVPVDGKTVSQPGGLLVAVALNPRTGPSLETATCCG